MYMLVLIIITAATHVNSILILDDVTKNTPLYSDESSGNEDDTNTMLFSDRLRAIYPNYAAQKARQIEKITAKELLKLYSKDIRKVKKEGEVKHLATAIMKQGRALSSLEQALAEQGFNDTSLAHKIENQGALLEKQSIKTKSMEGKLAAIMLDMTELILDLNTVKSLVTDPRKVKVIHVETSSDNGCPGVTNATKYRDCLDIFQAGNSISGIYYITPLYARCPIPVYCDMDTPPGGWTVITRRAQGNTSFFRGWDDYRHGFGDINKDHWLGNDNIFLLSNQKHYSLRIDMWDFKGSQVYAEYFHFKIDGERDKYKLHVSNYSGTAQDGLAHHNQAMFSCHDNDNDNWLDYNCALEWKACWWFTKCWLVFLTGISQTSSNVTARTIAWNAWKTEQLKSTEMKIRPSGY